MEMPEQVIETWSYHEAGKHAKEGHPMAQPRDAYRCACGSTFRSPQELQQHEQQCSADRPSEEGAVPRKQQANPAEGC